jgi:hypothetical protein
MTKSHEIYLQCDGRTVYLSDSLEDITHMDPKGHTHTRTTKGQETYLLCDGRILCLSDGLNHVAYRLNLVLPRGLPVERVHICMEYEFQPLPPPLFDLCSPCVCVCVYVGASARNTNSSH